MNTAYCIFADSNGKMDYREDASLINSITFGEHDGKELENDELAQLFEVEYESLLASKDKKYVIAARMTNGDELVWSQSRFEFVDYSDIDDDDIYDDKEQAETDMSEPSGMISNDSCCVIEYNN